MKDENPSNNVALITKSILFLSLAVAVGLSSWLIYTNPNLNYVLSEQTKERQEALNREISKQQKNWNYFKYSDVAVSSEKYPLVVLQTSYKIIKLGAEKALVGWKYEVINTSPLTEYTVTVNYKIEDLDGFVIGEGTGESYVTPESYGSIQGTVLIDKNDVERLSNSSWLVGLSPDWLESEIKTEKKRYERLQNILKRKEPTPRWVFEHLAAEDSKRWRFENPKWDAIRSALAPETVKTGEQDHDFPDAVNPFDVQ
ncbi:hypothetical protein [uncultured Amphritea sp.]|uniref:hypothetical protein n=1 Tax=uncultured Amphritea sp. TaxID=981605 RepID=UPI0026324D20|nr:hypothetical protein [uncultured Amphritea sp.]